MQKIHFLQSDAWAEFQKSQGKKTYTESGDGWHFMAILEPKSGFTPARLYLPYGPTVSDQKTLHEALRAAQKLAKKLNATFVRVEPLGTDFTPSDFNLQLTPYSQPADTWCLDLKQPKEDLIANMKQNNRSIYRNYHKKGMVYTESTNPADIKHLTNLLHGVAKHNQISVHSDQYLTAQAKSLIKNQAAKLHFIELDGQKIAAALSYRFEDTVYYAHAAADYQHRKLAASTALLAEMIIRAQAEGFKIFDTYGITTSDDPHHKWQGFTKFKKSFGGYYQKLSKTYDLPVKSGPYFLYKTAKKLKQML